MYIYIYIIHIHIYNKLYVVSFQTERRPAGVRAREGDLERRDLLMVRRRMPTGDLLWSSRLTSTLCPVPGGSSGGA